MINLKLSRVHINTLFIVGSSLLTKAVLFFLYIYVARTMGPSNYGLITSSTEYVGLFLIVATFGFQMASVRAYKSQNDNDEIFNKILPLRLLFGFLSFVLCITLLFVLYYKTANFNLILILSIMVVFEPFENHFYTIFWSHEDLKYPAIGEIIKVLVYVSTFFAINTICGIHVVNLIISSVLGYISSLIVKYLFARNLYSYRIKLIVDKEFIKSFFYQSFYFGIVSILYICSLRVDIQMLNILSGTKEVGFYSVAWQIVQIGIVFVQALSTALFPGSMANIHKSEYRKSLKKKMNYLVIIVCIICLIVTLISNTVMTLLYGSKYTQSSNILSILVWYLPMRLYAITGSQILESGTWYKKRVYIYGIPLISNIAINYYTIPLYGAKGAGITALISNAILIILIYAHSKTYEKKFFNNEPNK